MRMKPVCVKCEVDMYPEENGVLLVQTAGEERRPYKAWMADKWKCAKCGCEVLSGFSDREMHITKDDLEGKSALFSKRRTKVYSHEY